MELQTKEASASLYLPGLNGIRAIAALIVLVSHVWQFQYWFGFDEPAFVPYHAAELGVTLFFVLSGYLITYLLILEKERFNKISLRKFYIRRILRIWPLYYLVLIGSVLMIDNDSTACTLFCFFLMPNVAVALMCLSSVVVPLWSIGVEEQFYVCWPILVNLSGKIFKTLLAVIVVYLLIKLTIRLTGSEAAYQFISLTRIDCMAIGGLGAWWANGNRMGHALVFHPAIQLFSWTIFMTGCLDWMIYIPDFIKEEFYATAFIIIILNVSLNTKAILSLENKILDWIGRISYGIYLIHVLILFLMAALFGQKLAAIPGGILVYTGVSVSVVLVLASLSYQYFERPFIQAKDRFMVVKSTNRSG